MNVRTKSGLLIASMRDDFALKIIRACVGKWRPYEFDGRAAEAYELTKDQTFGINEFMIYLWEGTILVPEGM